ncbi:MAG: hypothetical protein FWF27_01515 [Candidatus Bathyarchaeota archaeon]|nr:hypothetical protein [Candidatus Termiticorpusculum sp.]
MRLIGWGRVFWNLKGTRQTIDEVERRVVVYPNEIVERLIKMVNIKG